MIVDGSQGQLVPRQSRARTEHVVLEAGQGVGGTAGFELLSPGPHAPADLPAHRQHIFGAERSGTKPAQEKEG